jgi:pimeloyl-ACP methyl ester carboxylesterase
MRPLSTPRDLAGAVVLLLACGCAPNSSPQVQPQPAGTVAREGAGTSAAAKDAAARNVLEDARAVPGSADSPAASAKPAPSPAPTAAKRLPIAVPPARTILKQGPDGEIQCFDFYPTLADMVRNNPAGPVLVALHGRGSSRGAFREIAPDLQKHGIAVAAVDLRSGRAFGSTENISAMHYRRLHEKDATVPEDAADIPFALDRLREYAPHSKLALMAEGPAACQALAFAAGSPERVEALFLFSPESVEGLDVAVGNAKIRVPVYATCGHGAEEETRLRAAVRGIEAQLLTVFVPPQDVQAEPGVATLLVEREKDREKQRAVLMERMIALCPK